MTYTTVYDIANDSVGLQFPLLGLGLILVGVVMKWGFKKPGLFAYPLIGIGVFTALAAGALPWWDYDRVTQAVAEGEAKQVEGSIRNWRVVKTHPTRTHGSSSTSYSHYERFSVGNVDFDILWGSLEAGFANRGSNEEKRTVSLSNGMSARIWYLPIDGPDKPPRIVRLDLGAIGWDAAVHQPYAGTAFEASEGRITDDAHVLSDAQKQQIDLLLVHFEQLTGHQMVVVTTPTLGGHDITRYATDLFNRRGIGRQGQDDGILLLVAPNERQARITVGRGLEARLTDATCEEIMALTIVPLFRRGDIPLGIEAGVSMISAKVAGEELR